MNHDQANELLAALALDAVDAAERAAIEEHVAQCPRCQSELDGLREVAGALGNTVEPLPDRVWADISRRIYEDGDATTPVLAPVVADAVAEARGPGRSLVGRRRVWVAVPLAVAAALVAVLAIQLSGADHRITNLQDALGTGDVHAALAAPGHRIVDLTGATHSRLASFVLLPDGRGYLVSSRLPTLPAAETYQLWGIVGGKAISIGLMGRAPGHVTFTVSSTPRPTALAVTAEPSGGATTPSHPIVASGAV
jgi:hypothetical protein